ncbi:MAG: hypothetical protein SCI25_15890 [Desulfuromonadales bacterium]|nr:hypothetical protein [Desulfuromonadales bacterium]
MKRGIIVALGICILLSTNCFAQNAKSVKEGYALNNKYCVSCHDSVANPERAGFTRDTWHLIIKVMHKHGLEKLSSEETETLIDYFYTIRKGIENQPG